MQTVKHIGEGFGVFISLIGIIFLYGYGMWLLTAKLDGELRAEFDSNKKAIKKTFSSIRNKINLIVKYPGRLKL